MSKSLQETLWAAWQLHQSGRSGEAERKCLAALQSHPAQPDALHMLGVLAHAQGRFEDAARILDEAIRAAPENADAYLNRGLALRELGRLEDAVDSYDRALALRPAFAEAAVNRGVALKALHRLDEALASYDRAIESRPDLAVAHFNRGILLQEAERLGESLESYGRAIALKPDYAAACGNRGYVLRTLRRFEDALADYDRAIALRPGDAGYHSNRGVVFHELRRFEEAVASQDRALALRPDYGEAHVNRGLALWQLGRLGQALESLDKAVTAAPDLDLAHYTRGLVLQELDRSEDAIESFRRALSLNPGHSQAAVFIPNLRGRICSWGGLGDDVARLVAMIERDAPAQPFSLLALPGLTAGHQKRAAAAVAKYLYGNWRQPPLVDPALHRHRDRLRVGYLSADIYDHATVYLLAGVLENHDRSRFEFWMYSYGPDYRDASRRRVESACEHFCDLRSLSDEAAARRIATDEIDLLIDLKGFTKGFRMNITAMRPAPVIVNWLGYPGTLGHPRLADYLIGDPVVTPIEHAGNYSETLALMPICYQPNDARRVFGRRTSRAEQGLAEDSFVFCSFNQCYKISPDAFALWCRLLDAVPRSVLWLLEPSATAVRNLRTEAAARGIDAGRLVFAPLVPAAEHLARLQLADLALDTFPYTSHTTGSDALWAGVPLVTRIGSTFASRVAASLLHAVGMEELVTTSDEASLSLSRELALDRDRLTGLRRRLHARRSDFPLFDTRRFTADLERLYRSIWDQHAGGTRAPVIIQKSG